MTRLSLRLFLLYCGIALAVWSQTERPSDDWRTFRLVQLNAENLFDTIHDVGKEDFEYLPQGQHAWTSQKLFIRLSNLSREIVAMCHTLPPDLVALEEVENDSVMTWLTQRSLLRHCGYRYVMTNSPDARGVDVALLYQPRTFRPIAHRAIRVTSAEFPKLRTRDILSVTGCLQNGDTLHVFVCHLPSHLKKNSAAYRALACRLLRHEVDSLFAANPLARIVIAGDMNDAPKAKTLRDHLGYVLPEGTDSVQPLHAATLYNLANYRHAPEGIGGTYKFRGRWDMLDQIIVSAALLDPEATLHTAFGALHIFAPDFLIERTPTDPSGHPYRAFRGPVMTRGYSDHLPVYLDLKYRMPTRDVPPLGEKRCAASVCDTL